MNSGSSEMDFIEEYENRAKEASRQISAMLNDFILEKRDVLKLDISKIKTSDSVDILADKTLIIVGICLSIASLLFFPILFILEVSILSIKKWLYFTALLMFIFAVYICYKFGKTTFVFLKTIRIKAITKAQSYSLNYYDQIIEELGESFQEDHLHREELRFKLAINESKKRSNLAKQASLLISIFIVVVAVLIFGSPDKNTEVEYLYGTVVGLSGVAFVVKTLLDMFFEWLDQQDIDVYEKCVLILQKAQYIAREDERDAVQAYDEAISFDGEAVPFKRVTSETELNH